MIIPWPGLPGFVSDGALFFRSQDRRPGSRRAVVRAVAEMQASALRKGTRGSPVMKRGDL